MDKNYRIHTNIATDTILNVNMQQDYDFLEVLTMKLRQKDAYRLHSSNYGVIIGRVLANDAFGIPNAKISVFIERDTNDPVDIENIYPYSEVTSKDKEGRRYNLLPDYSDDDCYRIVGTFPNKRLLLDNDIQIEIYEKYWKYTTVTNNAGDYMIFGVPSGSQQIHVDIDLSDIGILSQKPRDFEYKGYNITMFDNPNQFKESTNLDSLAQLFSQDKSVFVYPFWGDADNGIAAITRCDVQIQYKFEPTCVFMGSIVSDNEGNTIGHKCAPDINNGMNDQLVAGEGTIEMIRKTQDGLVEEYQIQGNQLIDSDGVWCYQIPMNLDFIGTDEYGNIVPTDNPNKGIPTRTQVRFRISKHDTGDEGFSVHTAKYLVPMNPIFSEKEEIESLEGEDGKLDGVMPVIESTGQEIENMYNFGSNTPQSCFRDLYWNNVYSVKNYIPKTQIAHRPYSKNYSALKGSNLAGDKNPIPFNKLRIDLPFVYVIICIIFQIIIWIVSLINSIIICFVNEFIIATINAIIGALNILHYLGVPRIPTVGNIACISLGEDLDDRYIFVPGCGCDSGKNAVENTDGREPSSNSEELENLVIEKLAEDFKIVKLDLYQDWVNGCLYMPLWYWRKRKKKSYLFGLITRRAKNQFCDCNEYYRRLRTYVTCNVKYITNSFGLTRAQVPDDTDWHRKKTDRVQYANGLIKGVENKDGLTAYYYVATQATRTNLVEETQMSKRTEPFYAIRLYATDIILLGNLNEENLYGIPQFFKVLPSTTANIPAIATIEETKSSQSEEEDTEDSNNEMYSEEDSGDTITTGMNWRQKGANTSPSYVKGLFMQLACTAAYTKAKSCFNVERLSELGVNLDMSYNMPYPNNGAKNVEYGEILPDGFISKLELDDMENRAMFATMNHIGFIPQAYQDSISGYTTQVEDENTNYLIPKFRYIYPVDFDGRQQIQMTLFKNGFKQHMFDEADESYITFRLGADSDPLVRGEKNRMRHFYWDYDELSMPLYNNSFYFYFGVNKGSTAIDKFNKMFYSECYKNNKKPFTFEAKGVGAVYCPEFYKEGQNTKGYIEFHSDDIQKPYTYTLYNTFDEVIAEDTEGIDSSSFIIDGDDVELNEEKYILAVTDSNGRTISEEVTLTRPNISFSYTTRGLGTKFYNTDITKIDYVCNQHNDFYGIIKISGFYIDGYEFAITNASCNPIGNEYVVNVTGSPVTTIAQEIFNNDVKVVFKVNTILDDTPTKDCMCDSSNDVPGHGNIDVNYFYYNNGSFEFRVYRPTSYVISMTLFCGGKEEEASTITQIISVDDGMEFDADINGMPIRFMLGTVTDGAGSPTANASNFYRSTATTLPTGDDVKGWYGVHKETTYRFNLFPTNEENDHVWRNYLTYDNITDGDSRKNILLYKFEKMFDLSNTAYMTSRSDSNGTYTFRANGGVQPTLFRLIAPLYQIDEDGVFGEMWRYADGNRVSNDTFTPNIVGSNYCWDRNWSLETVIHNCETPVTSSPSFNGLFKGVTPYVGNYFAAFTNNGRYTSYSGGNCSLNTIQIPTNAAVNLQNYWKLLDEDKIFQYGDTALAKAHTRGSDGVCGGVTQPYFRAMFVDRAFDYNLILLLPTMIKTKLYDVDGNTDKNLPFNTMRISGITYNGIEMSYSDDTTRNIISADITIFYILDGTKYTTEEAALEVARQTYEQEEGESEEAYTKRLESYIIKDYKYTANKRLEYSYSASSEANENAITIYNDPNPNSVIWRSEIGTSTDTGQQILKELHTARINGVDIRDLFWSTFNKTKLSNYYNAQSTNVYDTTLPYFLFNHSSDNSYNGDFDMNNYPTKRLIDVGNVKIQDYINLSLISCSYGMTPNVDKNTNGIYSKAIKKGDGISLSIYYQSTIRFMPPVEAEEDYAHITFTKNENGQYVVANERDAQVCFKFVRTSNSVFRAYPRYAKLIRVLPLTSGLDGITYIKNTTSSNIDGLIENVNMATFDRWCNGQTSNCNVISDNPDERGDIGPVGGGYMYNGSVMSLSHRKISAFRMHQDGIDISPNNCEVYAVVNIIDYYDKDDDYHTKKITSYEFSEVFDARQLKFSKISNSEYKINHSGNYHQGINETCVYSFIFKNETETVTINGTPSVDGENTKITVDYPQGTWQQVTMLITTVTGFIYKVKIQ